MKYQMVNEELQIASCRLSDLTLKDAELILKQWETGTELGTLTMFYNSEDGVLVLNADDEMYESYLQIAEGYLTGSFEHRKELRNKAPESMKSSINLMGKCLKCRCFNKRTFQAQNNYLNDIQREYVNTLIKKYDPASAVCIAFRAGMISGKRIERARRKKHAELMKEKEVH